MIRTRSSQILQDKTMSKVKLNGDKLKKSLKSRQSGCVQVIWDKSTSRQVIQEGMRQIIWEKFIYFEVNVAWDTVCPRRGSSHSTKVQVTSEVIWEKSSHDSKEIKTRSIQVLQNKINSKVNRNLSKSRVRLFEKVFRTSSCQVIQDMDEVGL